MQEKDRYASIDATERSDGLGEVSLGWFLRTRFHSPPPHMPPGLSFHSLDVRAAVDCMLYVGLFHNWPCEPMASNRPRCRSNYGVFDRAAELPPVALETRMPVAGLCPMAALECRARAWQTGRVRFLAQQLALDRGNRCDHRHRERKSFLPRRRFWPPTSVINLALPARGFVRPPHAREEEAGHSTTEVSRVTEVAVIG